MYLYIMHFEEKLTMGIYIVPSGYKVYPENKNQLETSEW